jgi:hypothetical protein
MPPSELEVALAALGPVTGMPLELPIAHLTAARWLMGVLNAGALLPRSCKVFNKLLLYFSYGGVFYRTSKMQTENVSELPVAMVFTPQVLDECVELFPFDSGAMANKLFGDAWYAAMKPFEERFSVKNDDLSTAARTLVHSLYQSNAKYVEGKPVKAFATSSPTLKLLHEFLAEDLSGTGTVPGGVDHRQRSIELLSATSVSIVNELIWIGLPHSRLDKALRAIRRQTRTIPQIYTYRFSKNFYPDEYAADLQRAAREQVIERYIR